MTTKGHRMKLSFVAVAAASLMVAGAAHADGDAAAGAKVFKKCAACHTATEPKNKVGPSLMGVVGRPVATVEGYTYSPDMKAFGADGKVWDDALLDQYLKKPKVLVPKTKMAFAGLTKEEDILDIIAYLKDPAAAK
jgi:cytochrome c